VLPHALVHTPDEHVGVASVHVWQSLPVAPQAEFAVPGWHISPSQQPPLHVSPDAHDLVQTCAELHA
jgi:hypothetical protein